MLTHVSGIHTVLISLVKVQSPLAEVCNVTDLAFEQRLVQVISHVIVDAVPIDLSLATDDVAL